MKIKKIVVIKNINPRLSTDAIENNISRTTTQNVKVRRFFSALNLNPLPIISMTCEKKQLINF